MSASPKADNLPFPPVSETRYGCIVMDPPWHFRSRAPVSKPGSDRSPQKHYPTADIAHLKTMPVKEMAAKDAHVFMWITGPLLVLGVHNILFKAWGVEPSSDAFVWIKLQRDFDESQLLRTPLLENDLHMGTGFTTRKNAEYVIMGRIGSPRRLRADIRQVIITPRREHSRKPDEFFRRVEHYCEGPRVDMFAGADRDGWDRWGWGHREGEGDRHQADVA